MFSCCNFSLARRRRKILRTWSSLHQFSFEKSQFLKQNFFQNTAAYLKFLGMRAFAQPTYLGIPRYLPKKYTNNYTNSFLTTIFLVFRCSWIIYTRINQTNRPPSVQIDLEIRGRSEWGSRLVIFILISRISLVRVHVARNDNSDH